MAQVDQIALDTGFDRHSTGAQVLADLDLVGRTAIVTGGYSGIGLETTRALAARRATVVVPARSKEKALKNLAGVDGDVRVTPMDLADLSSVRSFAEHMKEDLHRLDFLINNAGIMACPETRIGRGWEAQFGVNHLGHFALTMALMPLLENTSAARVVSLSSTGHKLSAMRWDDLHFQTGAYDKWQAYGQSKTANALFANALARRLRDSGGQAFAVHPGGIFTPLQRHLPTEEMVSLGWINEDGSPSELARQGFKSPEQGCSTTLWAATSSMLAGRAGVYCEDCNVAEVADPASPMARYMGVNTHACDDEAAERLWIVSEELLREA